MKTPPQGGVFVWCQPTKISGTYVGPSFVLTNPYETVTAVTDVRGFGLTLSHAETYSQAQGVV